MWDEADLPDDDLRSVYGEEAVQIRTLACLDLVITRQDERLAFLNRLLKKQAELLHG